MSYPLFRRGIGGGFFLFFILSCGDGERASYLRQAEAQLPEHPDSAQTLLNRVGNPYELSDDNRAWYGLLRTWTDNLLTLSVNSDTLLRDSYLYYNKVSEGGETSDSVLLRRYAQSCYLMGRYYISADSTKQAEDCLRRATVCADRCHDYRTTYLAYDHLSRQLVWSNQQEALDLSLRSLDYYKRCEAKPTNEIAIRTNIATNYALCGDTVNAFQVLEEAYQIAIKKHLLVQEYDVIRTYGKVYLAVEEYRKALRYSKKGLQHITSTTETNAKLQLATIYLYCDSVQQAKQFLQELTASTKDKDKYSIYWQLYDIAFKEQDYNHARIYGDSIIAIAEKLEFEALELKDAYYNDVIQKEKQANQLKNEKQLHQQRTKAVILIAFLLFVIVYLIFRRRLRMFYQKILWNNRLHKKEIGDYILKLSEMNRQLDKQQENVSLLQQQITHQLSLYQKIKSNIHSNAIKPSEWNEAEETLKAFRPDFAKRLREEHPELTDGKWQLCILTALKFSVKDMAVFFSVTERAIQKRKQAIKENVFGIHNPQISLDQVLADY